MQQIRNTWLKENGTKLICFNGVTRVIHDPRTTSKDGTAKRR
jgi:hypothetical protein